MNVVCLSYRSFQHIVLFLCSLYDVKEGDCYDRKKSKVKVETIVTLTYSYFGGLIFVILSKPSNTWAGEAWDNFV